jgi:hypothetical protein
MIRLAEMGPVDYLVVEFPGSRLPGLPLLADLVDRGTIRILDLAFVRKMRDGTVDHLPLAALVDDGNEDLAVFDGAASGLLTPGDLIDAGRTLEPDSTAVILVYENTWAAPLAVALRRGGGQLVASARIPVQAIVAALDLAEAGSAPAAVA